MSQLSETSVDWTPIENSRSIQTKKNEIPAVLFELETAGVFNSRDGFLIISAHVALP